MALCTDCLLTVFLMFDETPYSSVSLAAARQMHGHARWEQKGDHGCAFADGSLRIRPMAAYCNTHPPPLKWPMADVVAKG
eukprot:6598522-Prymnesium_polylepis.3